MTSELPQDSREREIFLRALREYSEGCEPPALTPDCPYSIETSEPDVRACGEECMDLLGRHNAPRPSEEIYIGRGLSVRVTRRPRPRRINPTSNKPYDAREIYLKDRASGPPEGWTLAAILVGLTEEVQIPPPADILSADARQARIKELIDLTRRRGLDFDTHVLPSLRIHIGGTLLAHLFLGIDMEHAESTFAFDSEKGWSAFTAAFLNGVESPLRDSHSRHLLFQAVTSWALTCTTEELLNWEPPLPPSFESPVGDILQTDEDSYWLYERFTKTYIETWSKPSLRQEWLYIHAQCSAPCSSLEMSIRQVTETELALVMADKFANQDTNQETPHRLSKSLVTPAINFLTEGRRLEAAALFEAAVYNEPDSSEALNNLGFCLLPDDPERALLYLKKATETGQGDVELININRMLGLALAGRWTSALDLATTHLSRHSNRVLRPQTWLWDIDSILLHNDPKLINCYDLQSYAAAIRKAIIDKDVVHPYGGQRGDNP